MDRPAKPRPDFPLFAHATGRWAKKINGKLQYFGPWGDPQTAEANFNRLKAELDRHGEPEPLGSKPPRPKPKKPRPDFPLYPHPSGQWARRFGRVIKYFGRWGDPVRAEEKYKRVCKDLAADQENTGHANVHLQAAITQLNAALDSVRDAMAELTTLLDRVLDASPAVWRTACGSQVESLTHASPEAGVPHWDRANRVLTLDGRTVKRFRRRATNQEVVLSAFQEEGWPRRIDDPLSPQAEMDPKYRVRFTIQRLNEGRRNRLIRFFADGTGQAICWEPCEPDSASLDRCEEPRLLRRVPR
jgi:hypothetical protein